MRMALPNDTRHLPIALVAPLACPASRHGSAWISFFRLVRPSDDSVAGRHYDP